ncbi:MAG: hypothetical protein JWO25_1446 [Alphaproteobacteria bacterium]|nr:hypothetical protein [Alphaproteobacteria bacterium]
MKRLIFPVILLIAGACASAAPKPGARTVAPARIAPTPLDPEAEMRDAIAVADSHPLGSAANPIRVGGPEGEHQYLGRLRCADGKMPAILPYGGGGIGPYGSLLDKFTVDCGTAAPGRVDLAMDKYQEEVVETRPPAGFTFAGR